MFKTKQDNTKPTSINLIRRMDKGLSEKFLKWAFTIGRAILMIVYALALGAFIYRIFLDREIIDLSDKIESQQAIVSLSQTNEETFRNFHDKLAFISQRSSLATDEITLLDTIITTATGNVVFDSLSITPPTITMEGSVRSIASLNHFVDELKKMPQIKNVALDSLESRVDQGVISFSLTVDL